MKQIIFIFILSLFFYVKGISQKKLDIHKEFNVRPYVYVGVQGTEVFKVTVKCKKEKGCMEIAKKNAVQAILYKGIPGSGSIEPLIDITALTDTQIDFLNDFFTTNYLSYVNIANDGTILPGDFIKSGKYFKIGYLISVNKSNLRKYLENNNIIKKLGF
jgi:hypothetical protein